MQTGLTNAAIVADRTTASDAPTIAAMVGELLTEIMDAVGERVFHFDLAQTTSRLIDLIEQEKYFVFVARQDKSAVGFIALYEGYALYAEGAFGVIPELYVRPPYRSHNVGKGLISHAKRFGASRGWSRLEVTTPPLPKFDRTFAFYERERFSITGGRKLKINL